MIRLLGFCLLIVVPLQAQCAVVDFVGSFTQVATIFPPNSFGSLGPASPMAPVNFAARLEFADTASPSNLTGGYFAFAGSPTVFVTPLAGNATLGVDEVAFSVAQILPGPTVNRTFSFTLSAPGIGGDVNQAEFDRLIGSTSSIQMFENFAPFATYSGSITATPEPGSLVAFSVLAATFGGVKLRRRSKAAVTA